MPTKMQRLQISLTTWQYQRLAERAEREGLSMAEVVRKLLEQEVEQAREDHEADLLALAGIAHDPHPVIPGFPVSERPELYLTSSDPALHRRERRRA